MTERVGSSTPPHDRADPALAAMRRPQDPTDGATPSGWSAAAGALLTYAALHRVRPATGPRPRTRSASTARWFRRPASRGWGLAVAEALLDGPREVAVVGPAVDPATAALHRAALLGTAPGAAVVAGEPGTVGVPLLADRPLVDGRPAAYVCRHFVCDAPTAEPARLAEVLGARLPV